MVNGEMVNDHSNVFS